MRAAQGFQGGAPLDLPSASSLGLLCAAIDHRNAPYQGLPTGHALSARPTLPSVQFLDAGRRLSSIRTNQDPPSPCQLNIASLNLNAGRGSVGGGGVLAGQNADAAPSVARGSINAPSINAVQVLPGGSRVSGGQNAVVNPSLPKRSRKKAKGKGCSCESCTLRSSGEVITPWLKSEAKLHIRNLLLEDQCHKYWTNKPLEVYDDNAPLFHLYKYDRFRSNLSSLKKSIKLERERIEFDEKAVEQESKAFPKQQLTSTGALRYDSSGTRAELVRLAVDGSLDEYKHRPRDLWASNSVFQDEYDPVVFGRHYNREKRRVTETVGWQFRRNIDGSKNNISRYENTQSIG